MLKRRIVKENDKLVLAVSRIARSEKFVRKGRGLETVLGVTGVFFRGSGGHRVYRQYIRYSLSLRCLCILRESNIFLICNQFFSLK